jgi:hypothetical protein
MADIKVLVPFNFSVYDKKVFDYLTNTYSKRNDVSVTLFSTYTPVPEVDTGDSQGLNERLRDGMSYMNQEISKKERSLKQAKQNLAEKGFNPDQVDYIFKKKERPLADEIISIISSRYYDVLVLSIQGSKMSQLFSRSIHNRVLSALPGIVVAIIK